MSKFQLTLEQKKIVEHFGSPLRVLAGPGTGKTLCVVERIKRLVFNQKIPFNQICAITFTTVAAGELRSRLEKSGFKPNFIPYVNTLHGLATWILRKHLKRTGLKKSFRPIDSLILKIMIKDIRQDLIAKNTKLKITGIRAYLDAYYQAKSKAGLPNAIKKDKGKEKVLRKIERSYYDNLGFYNVVDWHDILHKSLDLIGSQKDICSESHKMTKFFLVDEYQDLSPLEQRFVRTICGDPNGLCIVGDDDQSIYETFRYADPNGIINFSDQYKNATALYITKCHRCPPKVIEYALKVIKNNKNRVHDKTLVPFDPKKKGFAVIFENKSKKSEIGWIVGKVVEYIQKGYKPKDIMILFTDGKVAQGYIGGLMDKNVPLNIQLKVSHVFKTDYFLWLLATLRWLVNNGDNLSLRQCLDYWEGIGPETVHQLRSLAISLDDNMWAVIKNVSNNQSASKKIRQRKRVYSFCKYIIAVQKIEKFSAIVDSFFTHIPEAKDDKGCKILHQYLKGFDGIDKISLKDLLSGFEKKLESGELENQCEQEDEGVKIMSMHSAKGCEAPIVFIPALEDDIIPGFAHNIEEKRRLFYVSLTRAKVGVFLTWAKQRTGQEIHIVKGRRMLGKKRSLFLDEILMS